MVRMNVIPSMSFSYKSYALDIGYELSRCCGKKLRFISEIKSTSPVERFRMVNVVKRPFFVNA